MAQPRYYRHALSKAQVTWKMPAAEQHMILFLYSDPVLMSEPCKSRLELHMSRGDGSQAISTLHTCQPLRSCLTPAVPT